MHAPGLLRRLRAAVVKKMYRADMRLTPNTFPLIDGVPNLLICG